MKIEILVVPDCPNATPAGERVRRALDELGLTDTTFTVRTIADATEAEAVGFTGSPTILVDGRDPFAEPGRAPALACRLYPTADGLPALDRLRDALAAAARDPSRFVELDGCFNFRDLGGYRTEDGATVAWRTLYRSDGLHRLTATGRAAFAELGVATVLDLRTPDETASRRWTPPADWAGQWRHLPLLAETPDWSADDADGHDHPDFSADHYRHLTEVGAAELRGAVEALAGPGRLPAVFHCAAGKDRTGVVAALVLRLLGVPAETVADDYALSEVATARWKASLRAGRADDTQTAWAYVPPAMLRSDRRTMVTFLRRLDADHGSVAGFATRLGLDTDTVGRLRAALLV